MKDVKFKAIVALGIAFSAAACGDTTAPDAYIAETTEFVALNADVPANTVRQGPDVRLMTYETSFVAVQGRQKKFRIHYNEGTDTGPVAGAVFLEVTIPSDAVLLDANGVPALPGHEVEITVVVDPQSYFVQFGPHGSTFVGRKPAQLRFGYFHADLAGHHADDSLTVWYQPQLGTEWSPQPATVDRVGRWIVVDIHHFSNYAVAW